MASSSCIHIQCSPVKQLGGNGVPSGTVHVSDVGRSANEIWSSRVQTTVPVASQRVYLRVPMPQSVVSNHVCEYERARAVSLCRVTHLRSESGLYAASYRHLCQGAKCVGGLFSVGSRQNQLDQWGHSMKSQKAASVRRGTSAMVSSSASETAVSNHVPSAEVLECLKTVDAVCFDVDSTVCKDEGIDELATFCGSGEAVAAWTTKAMTGSVPFEDALAARLGIIRPSAKQLSSFLTTSPPKLSDGIKEVVSMLHARGVHVYLVSGGFRQMITPVASLLGIPQDRIFANLILFGKNGEYSDFDRSEPTSRSGGKPLAIELLRKRHAYKKVVMVGDGATDLEARKPSGADIFIGYGGVQVRPKVVADADWFITDFKQLITVLEDVMSNGSNGTESES